jgi:hypothetical protein
VRVFFSNDTTVPRNFPSEIRVEESSPRQWKLKLEGPLGGLIKALEGLPVADLEVEERRLEDVVLAYYREGKE